MINASVHVSASVESVTLGLKWGRLFYFYERFCSEEETEYKLSRVNYLSQSQTDIVE